MTDHDQKNRSENSRDSFTAIALAGELDLTKLAGSMGLSLKYRWEEPMLLDPVELAPLTQRHRGEQLCYLYHFGVVVFINCTEQVIRAFFAAMRRYTDDLREPADRRYFDTYSLENTDCGSVSITNDYAVMPSYDPAFIDIICFVIAKSVALERIEVQMDEVFDRMEHYIGMLEKGKLSIPDRQLARLASSILNFKYRSIAHIMVLDKPEITWDNPEVDRLYGTMADLFELDQRYGEIRAKSETLMDITEVFTGLSHAKRATRLEVVIIILIAIEIVIYLFEILWKK